MIYHNTEINKQELTRGAGVLMPISALPSPYGIGTLGKESFCFVDFLKRIGCRYWQVLPVGPTGYGDSPYQSFSAFAGNPYFIDLNHLVREKLLLPEEIKKYRWQKSQDCIDYSRMYQLRFAVLKKAYQRSRHQESKEYLLFCQENSYWLTDYSLYMAVKGCFDHTQWQRWDKDIRYKRPGAMEKYTRLLREETGFWEFCQFKFWEQWRQLKAYANKNKIQMIGDIPLYVSFDSSDVWMHSDLFELDQRKEPIHVAGVPPDAFSDTGQRWGNPLYRWDVMEKNNFAWWRERIKISCVLYDIIRIDHFIGVVNYYSIPRNCPTAIEGEWKEGPGRKFTDAITESVANAKIIAEDLGVTTPKVRKLINDTGFYGMKVLEFGLEGPAEQENLPHNYKNPNLAAYPGTHDNETLAGYLNNMAEDKLQFAYRYFGTDRKEDLPYAILRALYSSIADVVIVQMQDLLKLGNSARMNCPSTIGRNWQWRMKKSQYRAIDEKLLREYADLFARAPKEL